MSKSSSSGGKPAQYWSDSLPNNATSKQVTAFRNATEKLALKNGVEIDLGKKGPSYYIHDMGEIIGYNNGKSTQYIRVEVTDTAVPEFHGHPISKTDYDIYMRSKK